MEILSLPYAVPEVVRQWSEDPDIRDHAAAMRALTDHARSRKSRGCRCVTGVLFSYVGFPPLLIVTFIGTLVIIAMFFKIDKLEKANLIEK